MKPTLLLLLSAICLHAAEPDAVLVIRNSQILPVALRTFQERFGTAAFHCLITNEDVVPERLARARVLFLEHPSPAFLARNKTVVLDAVRRGMRIVTDVPELVKRGWDVEPSFALTRRLLPYWQSGGDVNMLRFLMVIWQETGGPGDLVIPPAEESARQGVYHPDAPRVFGNVSEYLAWYRPIRPKAGALATVNFFHTYLKNRDMAAIDALIRALEAQGLAAAGVFGWPHHTLGPIFATPPADPVRVMLAFTLGLSKPEDHLFLEKQNVHVINLMSTRASLVEWEKSERGVTPDRLATSLAEPELNGATDPILVATTEAGSGNGPSLMMPIPERVQMAAKRAARWIALGDRPNHEKKLAILYYNNPPGKGNLGASYLNLPPSIHAVLETLGDAGYVTGDRLPSTAQILQLLERVGRNVETWAPGELERMVNEGGLTLLPVTKYRQWFDQLPERFRRSINDRWGPPEAATLMTLRAPSGERYFVIPGLRLGNIFLGPQILRASFAEYTNVQHSTTLPPHHGYVAAYLWYRHQFQADAVIHMGRHGTLEWLPGKNAGQAGWDCSEVILGDLPNVNYYIMDGGGEAIQARRRAAAVDLSHLTPMLAQAGEAQRFASLIKTLAEWESTRETSPLLAKEYASQAVTEARRLDLTRQLSLTFSNIDEDLLKLQHFVDSMEDQIIPLGLPTLGEMPARDRQREGLAAFLQSAFLPEEARLIRQYTSAWSAAMIDGSRPDVPSTIQAPLRDKVNRILDAGYDWLARLRQSPERELTMLVRVLRGEFLPSGPVGDPISIPDALPSGRNLHQGDPALIPTRAAWEVGKRLAVQLLEDHKKRTGRHLERMSMILWSGETGRHQGAMEAQALYLMGVRPEWNARGIVDRLTPIPDQELGRPRVNVVFTVSGLYRDGFADKIIMLDRAARLAASAGDNALSRLNRETEQALIRGGVPAGQAKEVAAARVFATAPGSYGFGLQQMVEQSRDKEEPETMAQLYLTKMNHVFSEKTWGASVPKLLENQLRGNETILHSRSSNLYGAVDNDDVYQYMGGLRIASQAAGAKPELLINNLRKPGQEKVENARQFIAKELNARNWNPKWIAEMQKEGYSGAREMVRSFEFLYGWQATAPESISNSVWQKMYDVYVKDEYALGMREFFAQANPAARQNLIGRLLEVDRQGTWKFSGEQRAALTAEFVKLTARHGVSCSANACGNRLLREAILRGAQNLAGGKISREELASFRDQLQKAFQQTPPPLNRAKPQISKSSAPSHLPRTVQGWRVVYMNVVSAAGATQEFVVAHAAWILGGWLGGVLLSTAFSLRRRGRTQALLSLAGAAAQREQTR